MKTRDDWQASERRMCMRWEFVHTGLSGLSSQHPSETRRETGGGEGEEMAGPAMLAERVRASDEGNRLFAKTPNISAIAVWLYGCIAHGWAFQNRGTTFQAALVVSDGFTPGYRQYHLEDLLSPCVVGELKRQDQEPASKLGVGPTAAEAHNPTTTETATSRIRAAVSHVTGTQPSARPARVKQEWISPCSTVPTPVSTAVLYLK